MSIFDLIFLASALATAIALPPAPLQALPGRGARAFPDLRDLRCLLCRDRSRGRFLETPARHRHRYALVF